MGYNRTEAFDAIIYPPKEGVKIILFDHIKLFNEKGCRKLFENL